MSMILLSFHVVCRHPKCFQRRVSSPLLKLFLAYVIPCSPILFLAGFSCNLVRDLFEIFDDGNLGGGTFEFH